MIKDTQTVLKAGYRLTIKTWENDGDEYREAIIEGLTKEQVLLHLDIARLFVSRNAKKPGFGNLYEPTDEVVKKLHSAFKKVAKKHKIDFDIDESDSDYIQDHETSLDDMLHEMDLMRYGNFYTRVFDGFKVERIPQNIYLEDVTDEFK